MRDQSLNLLVHCAGGTNADATPMMQRKRRTNLLILNYLDFALFMFEERRDEK